MKRTLIRAAVFMLALAACTAADSPKEKEGWNGFNKGMTLARKEKKLVLIDFYTDWCHWCKVMDKKTFSDPVIKKALKENYVAIRIDAESPEGELKYQGKTYNPIQLTRAFGVSGFPSLAFLDREQNIITVIPGYIPPETFIHILGYINDGCYKKKISLQDYIDGKCKTDL